MTPKCQKCGWVPPSWRGRAPKDFVCRRCIVAAVNDLARAGQGKIQVGPIRAAWVYLSAEVGMVLREVPGSVPALHISAGVNNHCAPDPKKFLTSPPSGMVEVPEVTIYNSNSMVRFYTRPDHYATFRADMDRLEAEAAAREAEKRAREEEERARRRAEQIERAKRFAAQGLCPGCGHNPHTGTCGAEKIYDYAPDCISQCYCYVRPAQ